MAPRIINIRSDEAGIELTKQIHTGLKGSPDGELTLPTLLLYNEKGLKLFEEITYLDEYYLTGEEIALLEKNAESIAAQIQDGSMLVELGSGNLRKIKILLDALDRSQKAVRYYALDLMQSELERTLNAIPDGTFKHVECFGLLGTYDDGFAWLKRSEHQNIPKTIMSMGSSIGNFTRDEAEGFVKHVMSSLAPTDAFLLAVDGCQDHDRVFHAYNDRYGITHKFVLNGLEHANKLLGYEAFDLTNWEVEGEYDDLGGRHRAYVKPLQDLDVEGIHLRKGQRIRIEESYKYNAAQIEHLWSRSHVTATAAWTHSSSTSDVTTNYNVYLLRKQSAMSLNTDPSQYAAQPVPSLEEWHDLWAVWDKVTRQMIPDEELLNKPIKLRNACIFYLGHIPTFLDMKLVEATGVEPTQPSYFHKIFERGIDPDVDNPEHCHAHSEIPDTWPELDVILEYQRSVRKRIIDMYKYGAAYTSLWTGRTLWLGFEHEVMHLETLLYMLLQSDKTVPPAAVSRPDFAKLATDAKSAAVPNQWFDIPKQDITIGLTDADDGEGVIRYYGWDIEKPEARVMVPAFKASARPITNEEYARYLVATNQSITPASWTVATSTTNGINGHANGDADFEHFTHSKAVRTVFGAVPLKHALHWPVSASFDELKGCAEYMGGRIPTFEETRSIYEYSVALKAREASKVLDKAIPAVNGHLSNDGVRESPPSNGSAAGPDPRELHVDLAAANVGFRHWHPMPVTSYGDKLAGHGEMGGLWEWTSSPLERREGFAPMKLYPAYSADFFDGKHNIVLGGSWATHPRVAGRKSMVNWYQRNYPYVWAGARVVKDI